MIKIIKRIIISIAKRNLRLLSMLRYIARLRKTMVGFVYMKFSKTDPNLVIFSSYMGRKYSCSPRAIYEELVGRIEDEKLNLIWALKDSDIKINGATVIKYGSTEYIKYCAKAKHIIDNSRLPEYITLRKDQVYTQCWHGTPLKRLGYDIEIDGGNAMNSKNDIINKYRTDAIRYNNLLSPSAYTTEKLTSAFNLPVNKPDINIIEKGYPRNDLLSNYTHNHISQIKKNLELPSGKKVILYAPTWRDNQHQSGLGYTYDLGVDFELLKKELGEEYVILFRPHYFIANSFDFTKYEGFVFDVSDYDEISELYIVSDILITDYSSVFFDYAILKRKIIFYMYDLDEYQNGIRDFYISIDELPGDIVRMESDLIKSIKKEFHYGNKYCEFFDKYCYLEDGKASGRVVGEIFGEQNK